MLVTPVNAADKGVDFAARKLTFQHLIKTLTSFYSTIAIMAQLSSSASLRQALRIPNSNSVSVPLFLVPSFHTRHSRPFSNTGICLSKLARKPIGVPPEVSLTLIYPRPPKEPPADPFKPPEDPTLRIQGPKGTSNGKTFTMRKSRSGN
jgi:hypothetical protein